MFILLLYIGDAGIEAIISGLFDICMHHWVVQNLNILVYG